MNKTGFDNKLTSFNKRMDSNKTKHLEVQKKLNIILARDHNFFLGRIILQVMTDLKTHLLINQQLILQN